MECVRIFWVRGLWGGKREADLSRGFPEGLLQGSYEPIKGLEVLGDARHGEAEHLGGSGGSCMNAERGEEASEGKSGWHDAHIGLLSHAEGRC